MTKNDPEATKKSLEAVLSKYTGETERRLVAFVPEIKEAGLALGSDADYIEDLKHEFKDILTVLSDAYADTDLDLSLKEKSSVPDIMARFTITRLVAWYMDTKNKEARQRAFKSLMEYLGRITDNDISGIKNLKDLFKLVFRIKPVDYNDITEWKEIQKAIATSL